MTEHVNGTILSANLQPLFRLSLVFLTAGWMGEVRGTADSRLRAALLLSAIADPGLQPARSTEWARARSFAWWSTRMERRGVFGERSRRDRAEPRRALDRAGAVRAGRAHLAGPNRRMERALAASTEP